MDILVYLRSDGQYICVGETIMTVFSTQDQMNNIYYLVTLPWLCLLLIIILCDVLIDNGCFFFLRSDGKYIVTLSWLCFCVLLYSVMF